MMNLLPDLGLLERLVQWLLNRQQLFLYPFFDPLGLLGEDESHASPRFKRYGPYYLWHEL